MRIAFIISLFFVAGRFLFINADYPETLTDIKTKKKDFAMAYKTASRTEEKKMVISEAKTYLEDALVHTIFPAWYGNPWSFSGDSAHPFEGTIACGAFIENTLKNMGFRLHYRLSTQPSEYIIKNLSTTTKIERFSQVPLDTFIGRIKELGEGVYIVGLDNHVGFLYNLNGKMRFVHSHGYLCVVAEIPSLSIPLKRSKYRVAGKLFDSAMVEKWLLNEPFPLMHDYFKTASN